MSQFRLRTLFLAIAGLCLALAVLRNLSALSIAVGILFALAIIAHVAGNALGRRLRDQQPLEDEHDTLVKRARASTEHVDSAPATRLSHRIALSWTIFVITFLGALGGGCGGSLLFLKTIKGSNLTLANLGLGTVSFVILGGIFGFWIGSFLEVFIVTVFQAQRESGTRRAHTRNIQSAR